MGQKFSKDKIPLHKVFVDQFPLALQEVAKCSQAGHNKYPEDTDWMNFKRVENPQFEYRNAAMRHLFEKGVNQDMLQYGTILHEAQVIWNLLAALQLQLENKDSQEKFDDFKLITLKGLVQDISNDQLLGATVRELVK